MMVYVYIFLASIVTSLISLMGILFFKVPINKLEKVIMFLVSLSAGTLLGDSFLHLLPESVESLENNTIVWAGVLIGIILFFILEKIICWRHCHIPTSEKHIHPVGKMNLIGDALHNLIDGMILAGSFIVDFNLGIITTIAVISHEIPQEIGDFGVLIHAGFSTKKALLFNFFSALASILGAVIIIFLGQKIIGLSDLILPITAGGFIYISASDLIPELKKDVSINKTIKQLLGIFLGLGIMILVKFIFE
jgi:zinc and cadmium transporter